MLDMELDEDKIINKFIKFEKESYKKFNDLYERIEEDREFCSGEQYDEDDKKALGADVRFQLNICQNAVRSITSTYIPNQFGLQYNRTELNPLVKDFLSNCENQGCGLEALRDAVTGGLGILVFSTDYDVDGSIKPCLYNLSDIRNVRLDPYANKTNFTDAKEGAIFEIRKKKEVERDYDIELNGNSKPLVDVSDEYDCKEYIPLVTYYVKDDKEKNVKVYTLLNDSVINLDVLEYSYIPIIPVFGESIFLDNEKTYQGIIRQLRPIQNLVNYNYRQLMLRCELAPKNTWLLSSGAVEGYEQHYKNSNKNMNPLLIYNSHDPSGQIQYEKPERISNEVQFSDVSGILQSSLNLVNNVIGIPSMGLETAIEKTATEVLQNSKTFNNNIRTYIENLKMAYRTIGMLFAEEMNKRTLYGQIKVEVIEGPDEAMKKQEARLLLQGYAPLISDEETKQKLMVASCGIEKDNEYIVNFANSLVPQPTKGELEAQQLLQQADNEIKLRDQQIMELGAQLNEMKLQSDLNAYSTEQQLLLKKVEHEQKKELMILEAQIEANNPITIAKEESELTREQMKTEQQAMILQEQMLKSNGGL